MKYKDFIQKLLSEKQDENENILADADNTAIYYVKPNEKRKSAKKADDELLLKLCSTDNGVTSGVTYMCDCAEDTGGGGEDSSPCALYCSEYAPCPTWCGTDCPTDSTNPCEGTDVNCPTFITCLQYCPTVDICPEDCLTYTDICECYTGANTCGTNTPYCSCDANCYCYNLAKPCVAYTAYCSCDRNCVCDSECASNPALCVQYTSYCSSDCPSDNVPCPEHCPEHCEPYTASCYCYQGSFTCGLNVRDCSCFQTVQSCECYTGSNTCNVNISYCDSDCNCDSCDGCDTQYCPSNCGCYGYCYSYQVSYKWYIAFTIRFHGRIGEDTYIIGENVTKGVDMGSYNSYEAIASLVGTTADNVAALWQTKSFTYNGMPYKTYWSSGTSRVTSKKIGLSGLTKYAVGHQTATFNVTSDVNGSTNLLPSNAYLGQGRNVYLLATYLEQNHYAIKINGPAIENGFQSEVISPYGAIYGFIYNANTNYWISNNNGQSNSCAMCRLQFTASTPQTITISYINYAEGGYDYGTFGQLDMPMVSGTSKTNARLSLSASSYNVNSINTIDYEIPTGVHFLDIKYTKDNSVNSNNDCLKFFYKTNENEIGKAHYDVIFGAPIGVSAKTGSNGICSLYSSASTSMVSAAIHREGTQDIFVTCLTGQMTEVTPASNHKLTTTKILSEWAPDAALSAVDRRYLTRVIDSENAINGTDLPNSTGTTYNCYDYKDEYGSITWGFSPNGLEGYESYITNVRIEATVARESYDDEFEEDGEWVAVTNAAWIIVKKGNTTLIQENVNSTTAYMVSWTGNSLTISDINNLTVEIGFGWNGIVVSDVSLYITLNAPAPSFTQNNSLVWTDDMGLIQNPDLPPTKKGTRLHDIKSLSGTPRCIVYDVKN